MEVGQEFNQAEAEERARRASSISSYNSLSAKAAPSKTDPSLIKQSVVQDESPVSKPKVSTKPLAQSTGLGIQDNITPSFEDLKLMRPMLSASQSHMNIPKF